MWGGGWVFGGKPAALDFRHLIFKEEKRKRGGKAKIIFSALGVRGKFFWLHFPACVLSLSHTPRSSDRPVAFHVTSQRHWNSSVRSTSQLRLMCEIDLHMEMPPFCCELHWTLLWRHGSSVIASLSQYLSWMPRLWVTMGGQGILVPRRGASSRGWQVLESPKKLDFAKVLTFTTLITF